MSSPIDAQTRNGIAGDSSAFPWQLDLVQRRMLFIRLSEDDIRNASFLDERVGTQGRDGFWLPTEAVIELAAAVMATTPPTYIFHIGHCGSTLLTRMLEQRAEAQALREPMVLRSLAMAGNELDSALSRLSASMWNALLHAVAKLLNRPLLSGQRIFMKATSICNNLIAPLLAKSAEARSIFLYIPLESYLATMLKGSGGGLDGLHGAPARLQFLHAHLGDDAWRLHQMDAAQILAMGWLAELTRFKQIETSLEATGQIMLSNFEDILEDPEHHVRTIADHLRLKQKRGEDVPLAKSSVMTRYAKSPDHAYSKADRKHDLDLSRRAFAPQIAQGLQWAEQLIKRHPQLHAMEAVLR